MTEIMTQFIENKAPNTLEFVWQSLLSDCALVIVYFLAWVRLSIVHYLEDNERNKWS